LLILKPHSQRPAPPSGPRSFFEPLEERRLLASATFAVIGDFGADGPGEGSVAAMVKSWNPSFVTTVGDNNYPDGSAGTIDVNIGKHYSQYIYPYKGTFGGGTGSLDHINHFFPILGNHDWVTSGAGPYLNYFTLPGNERYYTFTQGPVQFFMLDADPHEPDLQYVNSTTNTQNSTEGQWLKNALAASTAPWKLVYLHQSPYSSGLTHGNSPWMQWPYQQWGASAVLSGHDHHYERILKNNFPYLVNGLGGAEIRNTYKPAIESGSVIHYGGDYGAIKVDATDTLITFKFITRSGQTIDTYTLDKTKPPPPPPPGTPAAPTNLTATASTTATGTISLRWSDNASNESGYKVERSTDGANFYPLAGTGANGTSNSNTGLTPGRRYWYRVYAWNASGNSDYSNIASAVAGQSTPPPTTPAAPTGLAASAASSSQINLTWKDNATNETGYRVEKSTDGATWSLFSNLGVNRTSVSVTGLAASTKYYFRVQALGSSANSAYSNTASATTLGSQPGALPAPTFTSLVASTSVAHALNLTWTDNASSESGYKIERSTDGTNFYILTGTGANSTFTRDSNLTAGKRYYYRIYAWNASGRSAYSNVLSAVAP
jgi:tartrate-resistant acid phosphatase type 5